MPQLCSYMDVARPGDGQRWEGDFFWEGVGWQAVRSGLVVLAATNTWWAYNLPFLPSTFSSSKATVWEDNFISAVKSGEFAAEQPPLTSFYSSHASDRPLGCKPKE